MFSKCLDSLGQLVKREQVHTPPFTANILIGYTITKLKLSIDFSGNINSPMLLPVLPNDYRPSYSPWFYLLNLQLTKKLPYGFEIYGGAKNLLNFIPQNPLMRPQDPFDKKKLMTLLIIQTDTLLMPDTIMRQYKE